MLTTIFNNHNLNKIYLSESIRNLGYSMIQVFIPIYLLNHGYNLKEVVIFYIIASVAHIVLAIPAGYLGAKIGYKYLILISVPFFILFFLFFQNVEHLLIPFWLLSIIKEIGGTFYWVGKHSFMGFYTDKGKVGAQMGINKILSSVAKIPAPLIGGFILSFLNIHFLIITVSVLMTIAVIPLIFIKEEWHDKEFSVKKLFSKLHLKNTPIFMVQGFDNVIASDLVWPVYLYFSILFKYVALGFINFLGDAVSLISNYITGVFSDKNYKRTLRIGAVSTFIIWIGRILLRTPLQAYAVDSISGITDNFVQIPFGSTSYAIAKENHFLQFIVFREMAIHIGKLIALFAVLAIGSIQYALFLGLLYPLGYLIFRFYRKEDLNKITD